MNSMIRQKSADIFVGDLQRYKDYFPGVFLKKKIIHYSFLNGKNLKPPVLCEVTHSTRSHRLQCARPHSVICAHKVATQWGLSAAAQLHGFWLDVSLYLCRSPSPRLVMFSHSQPPRVSTDGWRGAEGRRGNWNKKRGVGEKKGRLHPLSFSSLNPN